MNLEPAKEILRLRLSQMLINEKIKGKSFEIPIHLALGHEAIAVAVDNIMEENDQLVLSHRNVHYNLARAKALKPELDEYLLRKDGLACGELGSMNLANESKNIVYTSSILANNLSVAAGLALGKKVKKEQGVVIVETGDGAMEEGSFYETLEFLRSNNLPVLIIVENNGWSLATEIKERRCDIDLQKFSQAFGIRYANLKSNNVYEYIEKLKELRNLSLNETSPIVIEVELTTLGCWRMKSETDPVGRFINYHAGSAPEITTGNGFKFDDSEKDPVFVFVS
ncbi:MAG: hypothetical protein HYT36_00950, partial [Candidatus Staskawiczbacteria bacterium]|nr:hypothetical protein [Candidatus Staskawiczbacteria bacterium]